MIPEGKIVPQIYRALTRRERHEELVEYAIEGAVQQVKRAWDIAGGKGAININVLWEMGGAPRVLHGVLERTRGLVAGVTCGAGMPYKLSEIAASYNVNYLPIISSARAFSALWKRAYSKAAQWLAAVVYEDPWLAGGHNGLSNAENPLEPQDPVSPRQGAARDDARGGHFRRRHRSSWRAGVWYLRDWNDWVDNPGTGTDCVPVRHPPAADARKPDSAGLEGPSDPDRGRRGAAPPLLADRLLFVSAVRNPFLRALEARSERQIAFSTQEAGDHVFQLDVGVKGKNFWVTRGDLLRAREWFGAGFTDALKTPDNTLVFVTPNEKQVTIRKDQADCMGCLSQCLFSQLGGYRDQLDRAPRRPAQLLHPEDAAGHRPRWRHRAEPDVRGPCRV